MSNIVKDINIKIHTYYFFDDIINIKDFDPNNIKIYVTQKYSYLLYCICDDQKGIKIYSLNPLYLIFNKVNGYFEQTNGNKYLTLVPTNESNEKIKKKYGELWSKIRDIIISITKNSDDYDENSVKINFHSDDILPLNKTIQIAIVAIVVRAVFHEYKKQYPQALLDECLHKT